MANLSCPSTELNFLSPNGFTLSIDRLPDVAFFTQEIALPGITLPALEQPTPFSVIEVPSDKMIFEPLTLTFAVDEKMKNWLSVFKWLQGLGFPKDYSQYVEENDRGMPGSSELARNYSDAKLIVLGSNNMPVKTFNFVDCFPTSLGGITFATTNNDVQYATATLTLGYTLYYPS